MLFAPIVMVTKPTNQSSVPLVHHDLSDLGSEIVIRILPKERTLSLQNNACLHTPYVVCIHLSLSLTL